ncbi:MAG: septum formation protein Maf [Peptostreptococcaceae bacterium]|nr:septum formation protein Maf [Peptostreptococcaceae bacterium]
MKDYNIILASSSPRRIEMLREDGINPIIINPEVDESIKVPMNMEDTVMFLAVKKAISVEITLLNQIVNKNSIIIGADTIVYSDRIIGKPETREEAFNILSELNGKSHLVATGVALIEPFSERRKVFCEITKVYFKKYSESDILAYINTDEPYDKAGGYAIQGAWGKFIDHIEGDFENVIGFPLARIKEEISNF